MGSREQSSRSPDAVRDPTASALGSTRSGTLRSCSGVAAAGLDGGDEGDLGVVGNRLVQGPVAVEQDEGAVLHVEDAGGVARALEPVRFESALHPAGVLVGKPGQVD